MFHVKPFASTCRAADSAVETLVVVAVRAILRLPISPAAWKRIGRAGKRVSGRRLILAGWTATPDSSRRAWRVDADPARRLILGVLATTTRIMASCRIPASTRHVRLDPAEPGALLARGRHAPTSMDVCPGRMRPVVKYRSATPGRIPSGRPNDVVQGPAFPPTASTHTYSSRHLTARSHSRHEGTALTIPVPRHRDVDSRP